MSRPLRAWIEVELCRCCAAAQIVCPRCGSEWELRWPLPLRGFPARVADACDGPAGCGMQLRLEAVGWGPPLPAADQPPQAAAPADLSDRARLERIWQQQTPTASPHLQAQTRELAQLLEAAPMRPEVAEVGRALLAASPAADPSERAEGLQQLARLLEAGRLPAAMAAGVRKLLGSEAAVAAAQAPPPGPPPRPLPCPADAERHRLADWGRRGWLPEGVAPSAIAAAYRRRFDAEPPRDPEHRATRVYSLRELGLALGELGLAPNPEPLRVIWDQALQQLELPSTQRLLQQQARLTDLREGPRGLLAVVTVAEQWLAMAQGRAQLLTDALAQALGAPVLLELQGVAQ